MTLHLIVRPQITIVDACALDGISRKSQVSLGFCITCVQETFSDFVVRVFVRSVVWWTMLRSHVLRLHSEFSRRQSFKKCCGVDLNVRLQSSAWFQSPKRSSLSLTIEGRLKITRLCSQWGGYDPEALPPLPQPQIARISQFLHFLQSLIYDGYLITDVDEC